MLRLALAMALALAGCAAPEDHVGHEVWTFSQRSTSDDLVDLGSSDGFAADVELRAEPNARQLGGQWHGPLAAAQTIALRIDASADMVVEWRARSGEVAVSGRCEWGPEGETKEVSLGAARMANTTRSCGIEFTPNIDLLGESEPTLRWEARSAAAEPSGWSLRFVASANSSA